MSPLMYVVFGLLLVAMSVVGWLLDKNLKGIETTQITNVKLTESVNQLNTTLALITERLDETKRITEKRLDSHSELLDCHSIEIATIKGILEV